VRIYFELVKVAFQTRTAYKMEILLRLFSRVISLFAQVAIWRALVGQTGEADSAMGVISLREMVTYVVVSTGISTFVLLFVAHSPLRRLDGKIRSGAIAMDLIRPLALRASLLCEAIGSNLFEVLVVLFPLVGIGVVVFGMSFPSWRNLLFFVIALLNGFIIYFMISYVSGLLGFWYLEIWHLERFFAELVRLFSGSWIPLWFFPPFLLKLSAFLPFRLIYFVPITIYLGKTEPSETIGLILQQFAWMGILLVIEKALWARGVKKLVVQGG
jgi:ABC-2 type transport system permease protein